MTCSGIAEMMHGKIETRNCHTCKWYRNGVCTHPRFGEILSLFLENPEEPCPFQEARR